MVTPKDSVRKMKPTKACFVEDCYTLVITTGFVGPDGMACSMSVTGISSEQVARDFLRFMGWEDVPFRVS
jgi:hypothetical protein